MEISNHTKSTFSHSLVECSFNQDQRFLNNSHEKCMLMKRRGRWHRQGLGNMCSIYRSRYVHTYPDSWSHTTPIPDLQHCCTILSPVLVCSNPARLLCVFPSISNNAFQSLTPTAGPTETSKHLVYCFQIPSPKYFWMQH